MRAEISRSGEVQVKARHYLFRLAIRVPAPLVISSLVRLYAEREDKNRHARLSHRVVLPGM